MSPKVFLLENLSKCYGVIDHCQKYFQIVLIPMPHERLRLTVLWLVIETSVSHVLVNIFFCFFC